MPTGEVEIVSHENGYFKWNLKDPRAVWGHSIFVCWSPNFTYMGQNYYILFQRYANKKISLQLPCLFLLSHSLYVEFRIHTEDKVSGLRGSKLQARDIPTRLCIDFTDFFSGETGTRLHDRLTVFLRLSKLNDSVPFPKEFEKQALPVSEKASKIETSFEKKGNLEKQPLPVTAKALEIETSYGKEGNPETIKKVLEDFKSLLVSGENSDVKLVVRGKEFLAHRLILCTRSSVFKAMLRHDTLENESGTVNIDDCDPESFQEFLDYVYTGSTKQINTENVISMYATSDKYFMKELKEVCVSFMMANMSVDKFCGIATLALLHAEKELLEFSKDFFIKNSKKIIETKNWETFFDENPKEAYQHFMKPLISRK